MKFFIEKQKISILSLLILLFIANFCYAEMKSANYGVSSDSLNSGGNDWSQSTNYGLRDTLGESGVGAGESTNYKMKAGYRYTIPEPLGLSCAAQNVYMDDYTLGDPLNYAKYLFAVNQQCTLNVQSGMDWTLTIYSSDMTGTRNTLPNSNIFLSTNNDPGTADTITNPTTYITEPAGPDSSLDSARTLISGSVSAQGVYTNRPTIKLEELNQLYSEQMVGTLTITLQ